MKVYTKGQPKTHTHTHTHKRTIQHAQATDYLTT